VLPNYDFLNELKNAYIKIPSLQAIKEIPILAKTIKELSIRKPGRKTKETKRIHLVGKIADIMMGKISIQKYVEPGSPIVKTHINGVEIPNTLIDLGATINIMNKQTMEQLKLRNLLYALTLLQVADRSVIKPDGVLEDISVCLDSWEYPIDFMILTPKNNLGGHPLIIQQKNLLYILQQKQSQKSMTKNRLMMKMIFRLSLLFQILVKIVKF